MIFLAVSNCLHGPSISMQTKDAEVFLRGAECDCAKRSHWDRLSAEKLGDIEEMLDAERLLTAPSASSGRGE